MYKLFIWLLTLGTVCHTEAQGVKIDLNWKEDKACVDWVNKTYNSLNTAQRVAQCYMLAAHSDSLPEMTHVEALVKEGKAGGIIFFKGHPTHQLEWTNRLQAVAKTPLMIAIDGEWGLAMRLDSVPIFPHQLTLGAVSDNSLIRQMGAEIGRECKRMGIHLNFAPVVDINSNPLNPVINDRSFGEDKYKVAIKGIEYADGLQAVGVLACAKHFPGHGDTDKDSHKTMPTVLKSLEQLKDFELYPFRALFGTGVGSVMVAHLDVPALDSTPNTPASLSRRIIQDLLRDSMGYKGLIVSDALNMKGVTSHYAAGVVDSIAFLAGTDLLEYSEHPEKGQERILAALADSTLPEAVMEAHVKKVLAYKYIMGLSTYQPIATGNLIDDLNSDSAATLRRLLYEQAITIAANDSQVIPIQDITQRSTASLSIDCKGFSEFQQYCFQYAEMPLFNAPNERNDTLLPLLDTLSKYKRVIIDLHGMSRQAVLHYGINDNTIEFIQKLSEKTQVVLLLFGSPYSLKYFDQQKSVIVTYEDNSTTQLAAANILFGSLPALGKLPVSASAVFAAGKGQIIPTTTRIKIATPDEVGMRPEDLHEMDDVVLNGIIAHAYPGCQVLVAKDNKVIWNKCYGSKIYENSQDKVLPTDLYDLASISKIAATTLAVMKLYDEHKLDINKTVGDYLSLDDSATIRHLKLADILTHQAGLKPFFEFYKPTINATKYQCYYRPYSNDTFCIRVCDSMCMRRDYPDTMWQIMTHAPVRPDPTYVYSDVDFYILQRVVETIAHRPLDAYVYETIYHPLGLTRIGYHPLNRFDKNRIVPTEVDTLFRHQLLQGYVHDPGGAMYGGVAGHAGVFSNAFDLAALMQLLLNKGTYNGVQILSPATVQLFTMQYSAKSRRGLGFDKPEPDPKKQSPTCEHIPLSVFGHTGFTGTSVWTDPEHQLTFIFLSNRVYPNAENPKLVKMGIRTDLQRIVYKALR